MVTAKRPALKPVCNLLHANFAKPCIILYIWLPHQLQSVRDLNKSCCSASCLCCFCSWGCSGLGTREAVNLLSVGWIWVFRDQQSADKDFYGHTLGFFLKPMLTPPHFLPLEWIILVMHAIEGNISQSQVNEFLVEEVKRVCPMAVIKSCTVNWLWGELTRFVFHCNLSEHWQHLRTERMKNYGCFLVPKKPERQVIDLIFMGSPALPGSHIQGPSNLDWV